MGVITGGFGGVIRDILCNEMPSLFRKSPLYATCAFFGCYAYFALLHMPVPADIAAWLGILGIAGFRLAAVRWNWTLPVARS